MQTIYLDISSKGVVPCIHAKQGEVGRKFLAVITDLGVPYNVPFDGLISVWYSGDKDEGNYSSVGSKSAFSVDGNKVSVELVEQMLARPGSGELCLTVNRGDGSCMATWNIPYEVERVPGYHSSVPTEYYTALTEVAGEAAKHAADARTASIVAGEHANAAATEAANAVVEQLKDYVEQANSHSETAKNYSQDAYEYSEDARSHSESASQSAEAAAASADASAESAEAAAEVVAGVVANSAEIARRVAAETVAGSLPNLFASGPMILSSYQYGDSLPAAGIKNRIFFKKVGN